MQQNGGAQVPEARSLGVGCREGLHTHISPVKMKRQGRRPVLSWRDGPASRAHGGEKRIDVYGKYICWCQTPGFIVREKNKPNHRNSSSTENPHGGKRFPHQTSFIGYKYLIIRARPWNARHFAAFITCVGVFTNDIY